MNVVEMQAAAEAMLFASGEPLEIDRIAKVLEIDIENTEQILMNLQAQLDERNSGICLLKLGDKYQLCTKKQYADNIRDIMDMKRNAPLSQAAFEVLAVVAYNQPVTKSFVEQVRGVDCSGVMATLCQRGLLEEKGRLDLPGRPLIYGTTPEFLKCFCVSSLEELPELPEKEAEDENLLTQGNESQTAEIIEENSDNTETESE
ncbi:MAG: SMC-Scp complex subunit ScpB [Clostridia bacterium]|nr:SMC-Scp complex subunit ScpB [Clostridia bacterium]MBQ6707414.1 SMC-Scp complex subunit ScpB [Clostridia bacterium]